MLYAVLVSLTSCWRDLLSTACCGFQQKWTRQLVCKAALPGLTLQWAGADRDHL